MRPLTPAEEKILSFTDNLPMVQFDVIVAAVTWHDGETHVRIRAYTNEVLPERGSPSPA